MFVRTCDLIASSNSTLSSTLLLCFHMAAPHAPTTTLTDSHHSTVGRKHPQRSARSFDMNRQFSQLAIEQQAAPHTQSPPRVSHDVPAGCCGSKHDTKDSAADASRAPVPYESKFDVGGSGIPPRSSPASGAGATAAQRTQSAGEVGAPVPGAATSSNSSTATPPLAAAVDPAVAPVAMSDAPALASSTSDLHIPAPVLQYATTIATGTSIAGASGSTHFVAEENCFNAVPIRRCRRPLNGVDHLPHLPEVMVRLVRPLGYGEQVILLRERDETVPLVLSCDCRQWACEYRMVCRCTDLNCPWPEFIHQNGNSFYQG